MWSRVRVLRLAAGMAVGLALLAAVGAGTWALLGSSRFPVREAVLGAPARHTTQADVERALRAHLGRNFFALSPGDARAALEALPWVRRASVRRVWPDRLEVALEEHVALARWGDAGLVSRLGERFPAAAADAASLPLFVGPDGTEREMAAAYARFGAALAPLGARIERIVLTPRHAWQIRLDSGLHIVLGRDAEAAEARLRRFVQAYPPALAALARRPERAELQVDLRYANGFALRVPELAAGGSG